MLSISQSIPYPNVTIRKSVRSKIVVYQGSQLKLPLCLCGHRIHKESSPLNFQGASPGTVFENFENQILSASRGLRCGWSLLLQAMMNSDFMSALTSGFHTESSKSRSREPSLDILLLLLLRPALRLGSQRYGARESRRAFLRRRFCCMRSCSRSTLQRVARFSV